MGLANAALSMAPGSTFAHIYDGDDFVEVVWICVCGAYQLHVDHDDAMIERGFATDIEAHTACENALEEHYHECPALQQAHQDGLGA